MYTILNLENLDAVFPAQMLNMISKIQALAESRTSRRISPKKQTKEFLMMLRLKLYVLSYFEIV